MEDEPVEVIGDIGQSEFRFSPRQADGADEQPEPVLLMREDVFDMGTDRRFRGIGPRDILRHRLAAGLRRWMRLTNIFEANHFLFFCDLYVLSAQTCDEVLSVVTNRGSIRPSAWDADVVALSWQDKISALFRQGNGPVVTAEIWP